MIRFVLRVGGWFLGCMFRGLGDSLLVLVGLKFYPPTGRARWRW